MALVLLHWAVNANSGDELYARDLCLKFIDDRIVSTGAVGCLATGCLFALFAGWGFFGFRWIILKWVLNIGFILFGVVFFMPWLDRMAEISDLKANLCVAGPRISAQPLHECGLCRRAGGFAGRFGLGVRVQALGETEVAVWC